LNAGRAEIALVENATVALDMAFYSVGFAAGDRILTAKAEYASNYIALLQVARESGAVVDVVPSDEAGELDVEALERTIDRREQWFLDAVEDPERRRYFFSGPSMAKLVKLKDARAWARWLKEQFTDADRRAQSAVEFGFAPASRRRFRQGL
jgi:hypothetical protein